jgi:hypothetical protein
MPEGTLPPSDILVASAARFLIDGGEYDAASVLLACTMRVEESGDSWYVGDETHHALHIEVHGPRAAYDALQSPESLLGKAIRRALQAVLPSDTYIKHFTVHAELVEIDSDWRKELLEIARGRGVHNQAVGADGARLWKNLRFRSESEVRVARALDKAGVLFLPNCRARLGTEQERVNREADFLVCHEGKWGVLEVDGEPFHPPSRTVHDHERDRLFRSHGVRLVEHFDASRCFEEADRVVTAFLSLLRHT